MPLVQIIIDDSTSKTITGVHVYDRDNGGVFVGGAGTSFPGSPSTGEWFWRTDEDKLYRYDGASWDAVAATPSSHAASHQDGGADEVATATPAANAIPKAGAGGDLDGGWLPYGAASNTACEGNDSRLSDARSPTAHASSHQNGGSDEIATATPGANAIPKADGSGTLDSWVTHDDTDAIHDNESGEINAIAEKTSPVGADVLVIEDSAASYAKKKVQITNLPGGADPDAIHDNVSAEISAITEKTDPDDNDLVIIEDSESSNSKKKAQLRNIGKYIPYGTSDPSIGGGRPTAELFFNQTDLILKVYDGVTWNIPDFSSIHKNMASEIAGITEKTTPVSADLLLIEDSADINNKKKVQIGNLPGGGGGWDESQIYYVGKHGSDTNDGKSIENAFLTFGKAYTTVTAQTPSATNRFAVVCLDAGIYSENITTSEYTKTFAPSATLKHTASNTIKRDNHITFARVVNAYAGASTCWSFLLTLGSSLPYYIEIDEWSHTGDATGGTVGFATNTGTGTCTARIRVGYFEGSTGSANYTFIEPLDGNWIVNAGYVFCTGSGASVVDTKTGDPDVVISMLRCYPSYNSTGFKTANLNAQLWVQADWVINPSDAASYLADNSGGGKITINAPLSSVNNIIRLNRKTTAVEYIIIDSPTYGGKPALKYEKDDTQYNTTSATYQNIISWTSEDLHPGINYFKAFCQILPHAQAEARLEIRVGSVLVAGSEIPKGQGGGVWQSLVLEGYIDGSTQNQDIKVSYASGSSGKQVSVQRTCLQWWCGDTKL